MILSCVCKTNRATLKAFYLLLLTTLALFITIIILSKTSLENTHSDNERAYGFLNLRTNFSFPEVNETQVLENKGGDFGRVEFLDLPTSNDLKNSTLHNDLLLFQTSLSFDERQALLLLFQKLVRACMENGVPFFLYSGTLLGSLRHHDIIPWDDDIDIFVNTSDRALLQQALWSVGKDYGLNSPDGQRWKFFWTKPKTLHHKPFRWPYIDIFFFMENSTHIFDECWEYRNDYSYSKQDIFPLCLRPFAGSLLPVPRHTAKVVNHNYSPSICSSLSFSHKREYRLPKRLRVTIPCTQLYGLHPFAHSHVTDGLVHEQLLLKNKVLNTFIVPENCS